ncbi:Cobalt-precorrin-8x methylmutase [Furfurilactobacillus rossiae]|uniref:cobalt-precorrin-8 methylmutase n=1 Tax=Furfurilactobacillus rossiae TaxID=231049 RepID=UPI0015B7D8FF|nr:cobalt-precorrin-8 methylmutase [Furfurilactobacillus rossiae]MCF6165858.1 cobalt-precorrin-8 methylmutase [Furfurilactobacillus rossiae]QLE64423.1 Cobalt-precorrin-8x methylmutase [Furfurilactobacillus rossiae]
MKQEKYITIPNKITDKSFVMIQDEIDKIDPNYHFNNEVEEAIIKRAIHTTADFDYLHTLKFTHDVIAKIQHVLTHQGTIFTDTTMALAGINKRKLDQLGVHYHCYIADDETFKLAADQKITRSMAAIEMAAKVQTEKLFVIGNAPTALYKILEMVRERRLDPEAVIGVPVGFVEAAESKAALEESALPAIVAEGRKGGSNLAAALTNAILYQL